MRPRDPAARLSCPAPAMGKQNFAEDFQDGEWRKPKKRKSRKSVAIDDVAEEAPELVVEKPAPPPEFVDVLPLVMGYLWAFEIAQLARVRSWPPFECRAPRARLPEAPPEDAASTAAGVDPLPKTGRGTYVKIRCKFK